jgi:CheY-like chemotaxis protein
MERRHILVVEDQAILALSIGDLVDSFGYRVVGPATSLRQALLLVESCCIDGALLDRDLGGESSEPLAELLRQRHIPFAWATGVRPAPRGPVPVLRKPFTTAELQRTLERMFASPIPA